MNPHNATPAASPDELEIDILVDGDWVAGASGPGALREARHYAVMYSPDGVVTAAIVTRRPFDLESGLPVAVDDASIPAHKLDVPAQRVDSVAEDQRIEALMRLADEYAGSLANQHETCCRPENDPRAARSALRAALASPPVAAQVASGWISVDDRLPDESTLVLGICDGALGVFSRDYEGEDGWLWSRQSLEWSLDDPRGMKCDDDYQVTHWQPLPAAPISQQPAQEGV